MILYKYRTDSDYTIQIFEKNKVWLSTAEELNDPFECEIQSINPALLQAQIRQMKEAQLSGFLFTAMQDVKRGAYFFNLSVKETRKLLKEFKKIGKFEKAYSKFIKFMTTKVGYKPTSPEKVISTAHDQLAAVGIFSLSEVPNNALMWAHYGGDHKGVCLGFEVTDESALANKEHFIKVNYHNSVPKFEGGFVTELQILANENGSFRSTSRIAFSDPSLREAISTKGFEWEYEREWRYVQPTKGLFDLPAPIVEITFGLRCEKSKRDFYIDLAKKNLPNEVRFYEIQKNSDTKSLERKRIKVEVNLNFSTEVSLRNVQRLLAHRQFSQALYLIDKLMTLGEVNAELWRCKGVALGWSEKHAEALTCFDNALKMDEHFFSAWYQKGVALTELNRLDEAVNVYLHAQKIFPKEHSVANNLGVLLTSLKQYEEAIIQFETAVKLGHGRAEHYLKEVKELMSQDLRNAVDKT